MLEIVVAAVVGLAVGLVVGRLSGFSALGAMATDFAEAFNNHTVVNPGAGDIIEPPTCAPLPFRPAPPPGPDPYG